VPLGVLNDGQTLAVNWDALTHVLIASPVGQGAATVLTAVLASLAARSTGGELQLRLLAAPGSLPREVLALRHLQAPAVDSAQPEAVQAAIDELHGELDRRRERGLVDEPQLVLVVRELCDLSAEAITSLTPILIDGPRHGIRVLASSERPAGDLLPASSLLAEVGTRLVLQASDEDESVALLGAPGAECLPAGGHLLVRVEGRVPVEACGFQVQPDRLARLAELARRDQGRAPDEPASASSPAGNPVACEHTADEVQAAAGAIEGNHAEQSAPPDGDSPPSSVLTTGASDASVDQPEPGPEPEAVDQGPLPDQHANGSVGLVNRHVVAEQVRNGRSSPDHGAGRGQPAPPLPRSELLERLEAAPLRVRCFGAREVWHVPSGKLVYPGPNCREKPFQLLFLVAVHGLAGVRGETVLDSLWPNASPSEPATELRKLRYRLRQDLQSLVPDVRADPIPHGNVTEPFELDPSLVASDKHRFVELLRCAQHAPRAEAIAAYEAALAVYQGDLLDRPDVPSWWWLYDGPEVALTLRADDRRLQQEARRRLADLRADSVDDDDLRRAQELYIGLAGELADDNQVWAALFRTHGRRRDLLGLDASVRRLRSALVEFGEGDDSDRVDLPPDLAELVEQIRASLDGRQPATTDV
jgi:hypothetical protein